MTEGNGNGMEEVFKRVHELTKDFTFTAKAVEGKERWGEVSVKIQTKDISGNILTAMSEAIASEVANNDDSFKNMPAWMLKAIETAEPVSYTHLDVYKRQAATHITRSISNATITELCW